jgi:microcystin-dependent protein
MPAHSHAFQASTASATQSAPAGAELASSPSIDVFREDVPAVSFAQSSITGTGGSQPHSNFQPYLCVSFIISLAGIFPSQT